MSGSQCLLSSNAALPSNLPDLCTCTPSLMERQQAEQQNGTSSEGISTHLSAACTDLHNISVASGLLRAWSLQMRGQERHKGPHLRFCVDHAVALARHTMRLDVMPCTRNFVATSIVLLPVKAVPCPVRCQAGAKYRPAFLSIVIVLSNCGAVKISSESPRVMSIGVAWLLSPMRASPMKHPDTETQLPRLQTVGFSPYQRVHGILFESFL